MPIRLALAQINPTVGDLSGNLDTIHFYLGNARKNNADLVVFPEMSLTGYPPEDLLLKPDFIRATMDHLKRIEPMTEGITAIIGTIYAEDDLYNAAVVLHNGRLVGVYRKHFLPNYGVFDENRYFRSGDQHQVFIHKGFVFGLSICEDIWHPDGPPAKQASIGKAGLLINISASPYQINKGAMRQRMLATRAADSSAFVAYCNMVGGQDELVFDGQSIICDPQGEVIGRAKQFEEELLIADIDQDQVIRQRLYGSRQPRIVPSFPDDFERIELTDLPETVKDKPIIPTKAEPWDRTGEVYRALMFGTRDYVAKSGFHQVVLGLSGGIDSSLTAAIAADAIGAKNVTGIAMPSNYSSDHSLDDARLLANNFGMHFSIVPIEETFRSFLAMMAPLFEEMEPDVTEENIQSRIRGVILMAYSNKHEALVLTTGNKSEVGVGYSTLYGDTAGGFAVIKDVPKMMVYELCRYRNRLAGRDVIPEQVIKKAPSAELRPDQLDSDSLPEYSDLDPIMHAYVEESCSIADIVQRGFDEEMVRSIIRMIDRNEYKRRQSPPGIKITPRAFGKDWRLPINNRYTQ